MCYGIDVVLSPSLCSDLQYQLLLSLVGGSTASSLGPFQRPYSRFLLENIF